MYAQRQRAPTPHVGIKSVDAEINGSRAGVVVMIFHIIVITVWALFRHMH